MVRGRGFEFCCCALPLINVGAYVIVLEVAVVSFITAILALAPHAITAGEGVIPSWAKAIVAAIAFVNFAWQIVGLIAIKRETTGLYHAYVRITTLLTLAVIAVAVAFAVLAAVKHDDAQKSCVANYGALPSTTSSGFTNSDIQQNYGDQICNYFIWAQTGVMFGLIVLFGLIQLYMCFASRAYGVAQRSAARDYKSGSGSRSPDDEIPLSSRHNNNSTALLANNGVTSPTWEAPREGAVGHGHGGGGYDYNDSSFATLPGGYNGGGNKSSRMGLEDDDHDVGGQHYPNPYAADGGGGGGGAGAYPAYESYEQRR